MAPGHAAGWGWTSCRTGHTDRHDTVARRPTSELFGCWPAHPAPGPMTATQQHGWCRIVTMRARPAVSRHWSCAIHHLHAVPQPYRLPQSCRSPGCSDPGARRRPGAAGCGTRASPAQHWAGCHTRARFCTQHAGGGPAQSLPAASSAMVSGCADARATSLRPGLSACRVPAGQSCPRRTRSLEQFTGRRDRWDGRWCAICAPQCTSGHSPAYPDVHDTPFARWRVSLTIMSGDEVIYFSHMHCTCITVVNCVVYLYLVRIYLALY